MNHKGHKEHKGRKVSLIISFFAIFVSLVVQMRLFAGAVSMQLIYPWALLSLVPVAVAAFWALRRPMHKVIPVGSLRLWQRALDSLGPAAKKTRRISVSWLMLLAGATAAGIALSQPVHYAEAPARRIAIALWPSAELTELEQETLGEITHTFLQRLSDTDRVRLVLPTVLGGSSDFISPHEATLRAYEVRPLPVAAEDLTLPVTDQDVQHTYRFAPATLKLEDGPDTTTIALPATPGEITIDTFAVSDIGEKNVQVFVSLRNHTAQPQQGMVLISGNDVSPVVPEYNLPPGGRQSFVMEMSGASDYYQALITIQGGRRGGAWAYAVRRRKVTADVAIIGRPDPLIRRFVRKHPALRLVSDPTKADAVIAIGKLPAAGLPAVVIDPPAPPTGWRKGESSANFALRDADVLSDHPILASVDLSSVAVRRATGWEPVGAPQQKRLVSIGPDALILASANPSRVWIAFDTATENTNFAMTKSFVIFLANVFKHLAPQTRSRVSYEFISPLQAGAGRGWTEMELPELTPAEETDRTGPLLQPGIYRDKDGDLHAISLTGLKSATPKIDPLKRAAEITLPEPEPLTKGVELWPFLALAVAMFWLSGWVLRLR